MRGESVDTVHEQAGVITKKWAMHDSDAQPSPQLTKKICGPSRLPSRFVFAIHVKREEGLSEHII